MTGAHRDASIGRLVGTILLVPTPDAPSTPGAWELVEREVLSMLMAEDELGLLAPAFTTVDALRAWRPEGGAYVERDASWFFGVASAEDSGRVAIDLGSPCELILDPAEVAALAAGAVAGTGGAAPSDAPIRVDSQVLVSTPSTALPAAAAAAVREAVAAEPGVRSARLLQLDVGAERQQVVFIDLAAELGGGELDALMNRIIDGVTARTDEAAGLRFMVVTPEWREPYETGGIELSAARRGGPSGLGLVERGEDDGC